MTKAKPITECKTARDFDRAIEASRKPYTERQNGTSHKVYRINDTSIPIPQHGGDIPIGTRRSIIKMLIRAGLVGLVIAAIVLPLLPG